jgi:ArsR family transcriptional regulator
LILDIIGNETRRKILAVLSKEPMYFNQLAKEIGVGQQAILRHMQALEDSGLIDTYAEKSTLGAPDRKYYRLSSSFSLTVSVSQDAFSIANNKIVESRHKESNKFYKKFDLMPEDTGQALTYLQSSLVNIEKQISNLESHLNDLRALKQLVLHRLHEIGRDNFQHLERRILYSIIEESPRSVSELADLLNEKESHIKNALTSMHNKLNIDSAKILFGEMQ